MSENTPILRSTGADVVRNAQSTTRASTATPATGAAFKALIEKLEAQARELESATKGVHSAQDLAGAVDRARDSLDGALSLGESLIEAYREALHRPTEPPGPMQSLGQSTAQSSGHSSAQSSGDAATVSVRL